MYDQNQHHDLFNGPGEYLFRGTLPSSAFATEYEGPGVTPTSVDPVVATLFACRYSMEGSAIVLLALKSDFVDLLDGPNLASFWYEYAVNIELPSKLLDHGALTQALMQSPKMLKEDIQRYIERCQQLSEVDRYGVLHYGQCAWRIGVSFHYWSLRR